MAIYQTHERMYDFKILPAYAAYLRQHYLEDYTKETIRISYEMKLPLLKFLKHLNEADLFQYTKATSTEFLTALSNQQVVQHIEVALQRWLTNQLVLFEKNDVNAEDITIVNYLRAKVLKTWMRHFSTDIDVILKLNAEIDDLVLGLNTTFSSTYIYILKERIENELHFSEKVINASPGITYIYDLAEHNISYINGKVEAVMDYTIEEVLGKKKDLIADFAHKDDQPILDKFIRSMVEDREGRTFQAEFRIINKKGTYNWLRTYGIVYKRNAAKQPIQLLATSFEISGEKEVSDALLKREQQLLEAQAIAHIGSFEWDIINDTSESTPELRKIFESGTRQTFAEMMSNVHPDDKEKVWQDLNASFLSGTYASEYRYLAKSGEKVIDTKGVITYNDEGKPAFMKGTIQNITARKRIEEILVKRTKELERSNIQLQEFASIASHDLKEPIRKIATFADMILSAENETLSEKAAINLKKINASALRMQQLIDGILSYSSVGSEVQKEWCSLEQLLQEVLANLESRIKQTNAAVTSDGFPDAKLVPFQIQQLFQNLISNALKFSKKDTEPKIVLTHHIVSAKDVKGLPVQPASQYLKIVISDNGIGFSEDASDKIFGLFQRLHSKSAYEGSGLGLAICRKIAENHGGYITATSKPDAGATFTIILPHQIR